MYILYLTNIKKYGIIIIENKKRGVFMTQIATAFVTSSGKANEMLRAFEREYPKRKIAERIPLKPVICITRSFLNLFNFLFLFVFISNHLTYLKIHFPKAFLHQVLMLCHI